MTHTYELSIRDYVRIIRRRKWIVLFCFFIAMASSLFYTIKQKPTYIASATVRIQERIPHKMLTGFFIFPMWDLETETRTIVSFKIVQKVAVKLGQITPEMSEEEQSRIIRKIQSGIKSNREGDTNLIKVTVISSNPKEPTKIANLLTAVYIEENQKIKSKEKRNLREFVENQLAKYENALAESESVLVYFKESLPLSLQNQALDSIARIQDDPAISEFRTRLAKLQVEIFDLLRTYTEEYPQVIELREEMASLEEQIDNRIDELTSHAKAWPETNVQFARLLRNLNLNRDLYLMFSKKLEEVKIAEAEEVADVEVVEPAGASRPIIPNRSRNVIFGGLMGIVLGLVGAFISENLDISIGTIEEVEEFLQIPVLGVIPYIKIEEEKKQFWHSSASRPSEDKRKIQELQLRLLTQFSPKSLITEAFRVVQTNIQFTFLEKLGNTMAFVSVGPKEGKTLTATNCAITMAQMGKKTLLVDCDLRRPAIHKIFGLSKEEGLHEVLIGDLNKEKAAKTMTDVLLGNLETKGVLQSHALENLSMVFSGHLVSNPAALLSSNKMAELIHYWKNKYDVVIFDTPPVLPVSDASILASQIDGVVLVYQVGKVARGALRRAKMQLESVGGKVAGIVLNNIRATEMELSDAYYYYYYRYGDDTEKKKHRNI